MHTSIQRLRLTKSDRILVLHAPKSFSEYEQYFTAGIDRDIRGRAYPSVFLFVTTLETAGEEIDQVLRALAHDGLFWFCFPRPAFRKGNPLINRKAVTEFFAAYGLQPVAQRTINEEWTALRIRPNDKVTHRRS
ncbi:MAG: hypothetical protein K9M84_05970 [Spirochaetia bacterium]|nr:hypothetical protein [Spirochaetia bacterium]